MHESRIAAPYAKSLLEFANEKGALDAVQKDMELFVRVCEGTPEFVRIMRNPIINHSKKEDILDNIFKGKVSEFTKAMFQVIVRKNREAFLYDIAKEFNRQYKAFKGIVSAEVTTTFSLTDDQRKSFISMVKGQDGKTVELKELVDESIIGGFILKIGDQQIDQSIRARLGRLNNKFQDYTYIAKY